MRLSNSTIERHEWQERALCRGEDRDQFFPDTKQGAQLKQRCKTGCEVQADCLLYALATDAVGIWGGTSTKERQAMKRKKVAA